MTRIRFEVAYEGTGYCGWQRQNHGSVKSIQQVLEEAIAQLLQEKISLGASGRTDAGVHARAQVCHFDTQKSAEHFLKWDFAWAMRNILPPSIVVKKVWLAPPDFHSTLSAEKKTYRYWVYMSPRHSPFMRHFADWVRKPVNVQHLQASAQYILGKHDFKSFQSAGTEVKTTVREIYQARWEQPKPHMLRFTITGEGFLKQMVRNIVGTQLLLEKQNLEPRRMKEILESCDRRQAGPPAPAQGLFLLKVYYPKELDNRCREL